MARNYKKESAWEKETYFRLTVKLPRKDGEQFKTKVEASGETVSENIKKYVEEFNKKG